MGAYGPRSEDNTLFSQFEGHCSSSRVHTEFFVLQTIRNIHPELHITSLSNTNVNLITYADAGHAECKLIRDGDNFIRHRRYAPPTSRMETGDGKLSSDVSFGQYAYVWKGQHFVVYYVSWPENRGGHMSSWHVLTPKADQDENGNGPAADRLIKAAGKWCSETHDEVYVFDNGCWMKNKQLWTSIQSASWDDVILDKAMKDTLIKDVEDFFNSREVYEEYSVPWKRGIIFHGTPGCGKTISIKALMKTLYQKDVVSLYVKSFQGCQGLQHSIRVIFNQARIMAPCMLIFEDLDSLVVDEVRSYFLNEVDGLESNDGILMIGSTNHLDRLDPGIAKRPSRFDRKYHYKLPGERERILYCDYWRKKLQKNGKIDFNEDIAYVVAQMTEGFSFAYLKELFVQTLLSIVGGRADVEEDDIEVAVTDAAEQTKVADDSGSLLKEGQSVESAGPRPSEIGEPSEKKAEPKMPEVEIPEHLRSNPLMRILHKQAKALWKEMDNSIDEVHARPKLGGSNARVRQGRLMRVANSNMNFSGLTHAGHPL